MGFVWFEAMQESAGILPLHRCTILTGRGWGLEKFPIILPPLYVCVWGNTVTQQYMKTLLGK